jgi:hypothetical protein
MQYVESALVEDHVQHTPILQNMWSPILNILNILRHLLVGIYSYIVGIYWEGRAGDAEFLM